MLYALLLEIFKLRYRSHDDYQPTRRTLEPRSIDDYCMNILNNLRNLLKMVCKT